MDKTKLKIDFRIIGDDFNPKEVTEMIQIKPDSMWKKGEKYYKGKIECERSYSDWLITSEYRESLDVDELMKEIIQRIQDKKVMIKECKRKFELDYVFEVIVHIEDAQTPSLFFDSSIIKFINEIEAEIDVDLYIMS
jgi:hypothetical protein